MQQSILHRVFWGIVLIGCGIVFLLNQIGVIEINIGDLFSHFWPLIIILVGFQGLLLQKKGGYGWNFIVIVVGVFFLGRNLDWFQWELSDLIRFIVPLALIIFGLNLVFKGFFCSNRKEREEGGWNTVTPPSLSKTPPPPPMPSGPPPAPQPYDPLGSYSNPTSAGFQGEGSMPPPVDESERYHDYRRNHAEQIHAAMDWKKYHRPPGHTMRGDKIDHTRFIGDIHLGQDFWELRPMSISHFIGDTTLDLTRAQIPDGETKIYVSSFIGDVKVFVPNDFSVGVRVVSSCLIGDVSVLEKRRGGLFNQMSVETQRFADTEKQVVLIVSTFIGDVRVTKVG